MNKSESKYFNTATKMNQALLELLSKKEFEYITIQEICKKAGVNRSTFYLHYETIDDLLKETIEFVNEKFTKSLDMDHSRQELITTVLTREKFLKPYLLFIKNNLMIYKLIHKKPELFKVNQMTESLYESIFEKALNNYGVDDKEKKYILSFYIEGVIAIIRTWIDNQCKDDIDFIVKIIERMTGFEHDIKYTK